MRVVVVGGSLGGLASAARLARIGHSVVLLERREEFGPWSIDPLAFPAPWRDFFTKTGRTLDAELRKAGLVLAPDPAAVTDRGEQWRTMVQAYGEAAAGQWRDLLDREDEVWQALRPLGLEAELTDAAATRQPLLRGTLESVAGRLANPEMAARVRALALDAGDDPRRTPSWLASRLAVERTFGLWRLSSVAGVTVPGATLADLVVERASARGVDLRTGVAASSATQTSVTTDAEILTADAVVLATAPWEIDRLLGRRPLPWRRLTPGPRGPAWRRPSDWLRRPTVRDASGVFTASTGGRGGDEPWAQLLGGALAAYAVQEVLTGEDIRPTNKARRRTPRIVQSSEAKAKETQSKEDGP